MMPRYWREPLDVHDIKVPRGDIHIIIERCKGCEFCAEFCPREVLAMSSEFNAKGYHYPEVIQADRCVDCDLCEIICPDFAIFVLPEKKDGEVRNAAS
jgi:2-oxoglutarate ferredoxin oxidoreductase subunit delta